jgi:predicted DNA binding CopG/RHH family protein
MAKIPAFANEQEEAEFWDTHDSTDFFEDTKEVDVHFSGPRPRKTLISLRLDQETIDRLKELASEQGLGYQTLIRTWVTERLMAETQSMKVQTYDEDEAASFAIGLFAPLGMVVRSRDLIEQAVLTIPHLVASYQTAFSTFAADQVGFHVSALPNHSAIEASGKRA